MTTTTGTWHPPTFGSIDIDSQLLSNPPFRAAGLADPHL
jgi:hypothetical protein